MVGAGSENCLDKWESTGFQERIMLIQIYWARAQNLSTNQGKEPVNVHIIEVRISEGR